MTPIPTAITFSSLLVFAAALHAQVPQVTPGELTFRSRLEFKNTLITVGDVNGDGFDDILTSTYPTYQSVTVYLGNGTRNFALGPTSPTNCVACQNSYGHLADFNGDGKPDLLALSYGVVFIMLGNGDGTFQSATVYPATRTRSIPSTSHWQT